MNDLVSRARKQEILDYCHQSVAHGLNFNTQGNISVRVPDRDLVVITPHDLEYDRMTADDMVVVDPAGLVVEGTRGPSSEVDVHLAVYRARPDVQAVVHTEPIYANVFGLLDRPIKGALVNMVMYTKGDVPIMPFTPSNSAVFGDAMVQVMGDRNAVVWANHGLLTVADNLRDAFKCSVAVESAAKVYLSALNVDPDPRVLDYDSLGLTAAL